jgi:hypothetical protein
MPSRPLPVLAGVYYSTVFGLWEGRPSNNVFTFKVDPAPATGVADVLCANAVCQGIALNWGALANVAFHTSYLATEVHTYPLNTPTHPAVTATMSAAGGMSGAKAPGMVAAVVAHEVVRRGRGSQSRTYFSPMDETAIDASGTEVSGAHITSLQAAFDTFITSVKSFILAAEPTTTVTYVQLSKGTSSGTPPVVVPAQTYDIAASNVEILLSTQRRRMRRNG